MDRDLELRRVRAGPSGDPPPAGLEKDTLTFPGGHEALARAREVMTAVLAATDLPGWFVSSCVDDRTIDTCTLDRWSLRAWQFWLAPANRRWWWWSAEVAGDSIEVTVLVRSNPYLRGSLEWLFKASAALPPA